MGTRLVVPTVVPAFPAAWMAASLQTLAMSAPLMPGVRAPRRCDRLPKSRPFASFNFSRYSWKTKGHPENGFDLFDFIPFLTLF